MHYSDPQVAGPAGHSHLRSSSNDKTAGPNDLMMDGDLLLCFCSIYPLINLKHNLIIFGPAAKCLVLLRILPAVPNVQHDAQQIEDHWALAECHCGSKLDFHLHKLTDIQA